MTQRPLSSAPKVDVVEKFNWTSFSGNVVGNPQPQDREAMAVFMLETLKSS